MNHTELATASTTWLTTLAECHGDRAVVRDIVDELNYRGVYLDATRNEWYHRPRR